MPADKSKGAKDPGIAVDAVDLTWHQEENRPLTEAEVLTRKIDMGTEQTLESTRRMMALCEEAKESGLQTLVMLDDQGEQLDRINEAMDKINEDMRDAEKNLDDLNKCCGLCILPWNKRSNFETGEYAKTWKANEDGTVNTDGPRVVLDQNGMGPTGGYCTRITNDAREDEMDQNLTEVSGMIGNLRNMAIDMRSELVQQKTTLDNISAKAASNQDRIQKANDAARKLL